MRTTVLKEIIAFIFGRKYYATIIRTKGVDKTEICSFIFRTKEDAEKHKRDIQTTLSFEYVETISFRSRKIY